MNPSEYPWRIRWIWIALAIVLLAVVVRLAYFNLVDSRAHLLREGKNRTDRTVEIWAPRGIISDRNGVPLAASAPLFNVIANPDAINIFEDPKVIKKQHDADKQRKYLEKRANIAREFVIFAQSLGLEPEALKHKLREHKKRGRYYTVLAKGLTPSQAQKIEFNHLQGVYKERLFKRYYPEGEAFGHIVGITDVNGVGTLGIEYALDQYLKPELGERGVKKDRDGRVIEHMAEVRPARAGADISLSIDTRLQYIAYRELKAAVRSHQASTASAVILDVRTGEVLAMVNQPSFNPNNRTKLFPEQLVNRAISDVFEPGSTMKPFTVTAALMSGEYDQNSTINTSPGYIKVGGHTLRDGRNYGELKLGKVISKSSNVGTTKIALSLPHTAVRDVFESVGLGQPSSLGLQGESMGSLPYLKEKQRVERATMSYGYGLNLNTLQLAQAYATLASGGVRHPVSLFKVDENDLEAASRVIPEDIAKQVVEMMQDVVSPYGSGRRASIENYTVAGKTGTVHNLTSEGTYDKFSYTGIFAGIVPATNPKFVCVVMVNDPKNDKYYGGEVSAPVFARIMSSALRLYNVAPDGV